MNKHLQSLQPCINRHFLLVNPDGSDMSRRDISEYLNVSYGHGCRIVRSMLDSRVLAEFKVGPYTKFIANPFAIDENAEPGPTLTAVFKAEVLAYE